MAWITDSLRSAISALNPFSRGSAADCLPIAFSHQLAIAAYMSSGMLRKVIAVPAEDRVREWRDWQADKDQIEEIEKEEKRLGLIAKVRFAEVLRGIGGGALVLVAPGAHDQPLNPETIAKGGLIAINAVSRWQITGLDWINNLADPNHGCPQMFQVSGDSGAPQRLHPSRVVCFRGDPIPAGPGVSQEDAFWGDSRLLRVFREVEKADNAHLWFSQLVKKAKLLRIGIPDLDSMDQERIDKRISLIAEGEGVLNATVYRASKNQDDQGEKIDDYQVTWTGMPAMMDAFDQRVAAVADIPFTRLTGRSPAGMNSTGEHDTDNWNKSVAAGQKLETRPCLEKMDPVLLRSAGVDPADVTWAFAPLDVPSEKVQADTFKASMEAIEKVQNTGAIPDEAFAKGLQNWLVEREYLPGLDQALEEIPEAERYGINQEPDPADPTDPSALTAAEAEITPTPKTANDARFLADAAAKSLYIERRLLNADEVTRWAKAQGLETTVTATDMHVTIAFSRSPVDWFEVGADWSGDEDGKIRVRPGGPRAVERLGDGDAVALLFSDDHLEWRHKRVREAGASWDWSEYRPHVTITWNAPGIDVAKIEPYSGPLVFGPELFSEVKEDWASNITEDGGGPEASLPFVDAKRRRGGGGGRAFNPTLHPRGRGGRFIASGVGRFTVNRTDGPPRNAGFIQAHTGVSVGHLNRVARAQDLNHASRYSKSGRRPPSQAILRNYATHAANAHSVRVQGQRAHGSGLRLRSETMIGSRHFTVIERVGEKAGSLSFVTMWENV